MATIGRRIAEWVAEQSFDSLPEQTIHEVKRRVIDTLGVALGAYQAPPAKILRAVAESVYDTHAATVWGTTHSTPPQRAVFANAAMVEYLDFNDVYLSKEFAHPSDNIPAAVAVAETADLGGKGVILGTVIGYEIQCRLCDAGRLPKGGWDHVLYGALSSAMVAAKLWGLNADWLEHALSLAGMWNISIRRTRIGEVTMWRACAFSEVVRTGIQAADLARRGMRGPTDLFEGQEGLMEQLSIPEAHAMRLGEPGDYMVDRTLLKAWPASYFSQSAIEAALALRPEVDLDRVKSIKVRSFEPAVSIVAAAPEKARPMSRETADHSLAYCVATALLDGDVTPQSYGKARFEDEKLLALMDKVSVEEDLEFTWAYPKTVPNQITVTMDDGREVANQVDAPRGHSQNPMSDDEVVAKFRRLARGVVTDQTADKILDRAWHLEELTNLQELVSFDVLEPDANAPDLRPTLVGKKPGGKG